jgi:uncharacterized protein (TIGR01244 family)
MSKFKLFLLSLGLTTVGWLVYWYHDHYTRQVIDKANLPILKRVALNVSITSQLKLENVRPLARAGYEFIVDIRPDGEAPDQVPSSVMENAALNNRMGFLYIPVPHEWIPSEAVHKLSEALAADHRPTVLYCRTGRRAVRLLALEEASRPGGPSSAEILGMVQAAGFSADDLKEDIARRISQRNDTTHAGTDR